METNADGVRPSPQPENPIPERPPRKKRRVFVVAIILCVTIGVSVGGWFGRAHIESAVQRVGLFQENPLIAFTLEIFDIIDQHYWDEVEPAALADLYDRAAAHIQSEYRSIGAKSRADVRAVVRRYLSAFPAESHRDAILDLNIVVLSALEPNERSGLYSEARERELRDTVANIQRDRDLYEVLGVLSEASPDELSAAYLERARALEADGTPEALEALENLAYAHEVLSDERARERYDTALVEPTVSGRLLSPSVYYLRISQFSPQSFEEFVEAAERAPQGDEITGLILDLRGNVGGAIDFLPYFLGPFIGPGNIAYEFFSKGERTPFRTEVGYIPELEQFTRTVVLIDGRSQSSAEAMASTLATYNVGILVGERTAGWGTVENTFPIETRIDEDTAYSVFLVHSITLRPDGRPIETQGVDPDIVITDENWEQKLLRYYNDRELVDAVRRLYAE